MAGKGGVGKTTVVATLAEWYASNGFKVAMFDMDPDNKAEGSLFSFFPEAHKLPALESWTYDRLLGVSLDSDADVILADLGAAQGHRMIPWFRDFYRVMQDSGIPLRWTAIGVVDTDIASSRSVLDWGEALQDGVDDEDDNLLRLFNILSPAAFRKRAKITLVDPGKPLGKGVASRLRIIGGEITYEEHSGNHPFLQAGSIDGLRLPVTGGYVTRAEDKRIMGHVQVGKVAAFMLELNAAMGISDDYEFFSATEYLSDDPNHPNIFQNIVTNTVPAGKMTRGHLINV
jgi:hypothetical protein